MPGSKRTYVVRLSRRRYDWLVTVDGTGIKFTTDYPEAADIIVRQEIKELYKLRSTNVFDLDMQWEKRDK